MTKLTKAEQEVHIWMCADESECCVYITDLPNSRTTLDWLRKLVGGLSSTKAVRKSFCLKTQSCSR